MITDEKKQSVHFLIMKQNFYTLGIKLRSHTLKNADTSNCNENFMIQNEITLLLKKTSHLLSKTVIFMGTFFVVHIQISLHFEFINSRMTGVTENRKLINM